MNLLCNKYLTLYSSPRSLNEVDYLLSMHQEPSAAIWGPREEAAACRPYHSLFFTPFLFPSDALLFNACIPINSFSLYIPIYSLYAIVGFLKILLSSMSCSLPVNRGKLRCLAIILIILNVASSTRNGTMQKNQGEIVSKKIPSQLHWTIPIM